MKKLCFVAVVLVSVLSTLLTACAGILSSSDDLRYKVTVTVNTPEGIKTGFAVREAHRYNEKSILPEQGGTFYSISKGEAVVVDLGIRGMVFALLDDEREPAFIFKALKERRSIVLDVTNYPQLVYFKALNDPMTVENLLDYMSCPNPLTKVPYGNQCIEKNHFEEFLGTGVTLKSVSIEISDGDITRSIGNYLSWLEKLKGGYLHGGSSARGAPLGLCALSFQIGEKNGH